LKKLSFILLALVLAGCSGEDDGVSSAAEAQDLAKRFHEAMVAGDAATASGLARAPFRYKEPTRLWSDPVTIQKNLKKEIPRVQHMLGGLDRIEVFSRADLMEGRWPRGREIPKDKLAAAVEAAGVFENGWLVRVFADGKPGYTLVLNQDAGRLAVQALDI
jgi:hypothetical protein